MLTDSEVLTNEEIIHLIYDQQELRSRIKEATDLIDSSISKWCSITNTSLFNSCNFINKINAFIFLACIFNIYLINTSNSI